MMRTRMLAARVAWLALLLSPAAAHAQALPAPQEAVPPASAEQPAVEPAPDSSAQAPSDDAAQPSADAWQVINWVIATHDNHDMPFMVVDKVAARVFLYDASGQPI